MPVPQHFIQIAKGTPGVLTDAEMYAPHRDIANNYVWLLQSAMHQLHPDRLEDWLKAFAMAAGIGPEEIAKTVETFAAAIVLLKTDLTIQKPLEALTQAGFFATPPAAQVILCAKLGQIITGAYCTAVRDVADPRRPPQVNDVNALVAASTEVATAWREYQAK